MKFAQFVLVILAILVISIRANEVKTDSVKNNSLLDECNNPCASCQKTIYLLKFNQFADCGTGHCRNTCYKVKDLWSITDGTFKPFRDDIFGKCEICFRAGFCSIAECKVQQEKEAEIIDKVINTSKITGKKEDIIEKVGFNEFKSEKKIYDQKALEEINIDVLDIKNGFDEKLDAAFGDYPFSNVASDIQGLINGAFQNDNFFSAQSLLSFSKIKPNEDETLAMFSSSAQKLKSNIEKIAFQDNLDKSVKAEKLKYLEGVIQNNNNLAKVARSIKDDEAAKVILTGNNALIEAKKKLEDGKTPAIPDNQKIPIVDDKPSIPSNKIEKKHERKFRKKRRHE
jgi:hypothetical protein